MHNDLRYPGATSTDQALVSTAKTLEEISIIFKDYNSVRPPPAASSTYQQDYEVDGKKADFSHHDVMEKV
jgi:hypothetical protein